jgi:hypothetical protein
MAYIYIYVFFVHMQFGVWWETVQSEYLHVSPRPSHTATGAVQLADCAALIARLLQSSVDAAQGPPDV